MLDVNRLRVIDAVARHGSVTAAAKELHYSQPSVTHHLARLEAETGAQLLQRVGRGIRLTPAGQLLADRAAEIIGRIDAAGAELSAHVGLNAGRVRLAAFASANGSLVPATLATLADRYPSLEISVTDTHPLDALELLRTGKVEVAVIFRYEETEPEPPGCAFITCSTTRSTCSRRGASAGWPPCATRPGSPAASAAAATCCRCAPTPGSIRGSATAPMTWS
jgi:DNA-binding transcriptional LysR family regulator